ncbi:hypothetical protein [uncultured Gimesia sp.]|uniref:hypothetical protein n=1 Tax=uncultured Gimesia sp. TaxID=1678688 RepID=UPI0026026E52|nr:hypothetical protein [uncultured Gimesia sp.]
MKKQIPKWFFMSPVFCLILCQTEMFAADRSIEYFVSQRDQWKKVIGVTQTLEGRISTFNSKSVRFRNCPIPFHFAGKTPKLDSTVQNVEVTGQLSLENGRIIFMVKSLQKKPSDREYFVREETKIDRANPRDWYALADWAKQRAEFYDDKELTQQALAAYNNGIKAEYRQMMVKQPKSILKLADRAQQYQLDPLFFEALRHEALVLDWQQLQKQKNPKYDTLSSQLLKDFPTAKTPQKKDNPEVRTQYLKNQIEVFQKADKLKRPGLVRWFYSELILGEILKKLATGGSNGFEVAKLITKQLPERTDLVNQYQNMQLDFDFNRINELPRQYVLDLSQEYKQRGNKKKAKQTLTNWLSGRQKKLDANDADGRVGLARDFLEVLDDKASAEKLLLQAWNLNPKSTEATTLLGRMGFMLQNNKWLTPHEVKEYRDDPIRKAIRNGTVIAGMTRAQVKKSLGAPTQIGRCISGGEINELWIYGEATNQSFIIQLARKPRTKELKVVRIKNAHMSRSPIKAETEPVE